ncbi:MAG: glycosyltransferase family 4 protein [Dermatophilaceae bacterium]
MRIGIVSPYSFDVPGGVQLHVRDLAEHFISQGHYVSVLAPADDDTPLPDYVVSSGRAVPVRYNGSVARLSFGPLTAARVGRWVETGRFDVVHIHEPVVPSVSVLALWAVDGPIVATFHTSNLRSRAMQAAYPLLRPSLEKISARIAVSEDARRTVTTHLGGDAVVIPNGVFVERFASARRRPDWEGTVERPTIAFLGRMEEPRKGMPVLSLALPEIVREIPGVRVLIAGPGSPGTIRERMTAEAAAACEFLGPVSDQDKASLLASVDLYLAPNTGGESFGIILIEAMSARATVLASDLPAFARVLDDGVAGEMFVNEDPDDLARAAVSLLRNPIRREQLAAAGRARANAFDWSVVAADVMAVYETVTLGASSVRTSSEPDSRWARLLRSGRNSGGT